LFVVDLIEPILKLIVCWSTLPTLMLRLDGFLYKINGVDLEIKEISSKEFFKLKGNPMT
jgi:uncharacterized membrane protein YvlD (DUF360 family)